MHDDRPHHLLAQVPLSVSPFISLPTPTTLPYTYVSLPSTLPPSAIDTAGTKYVVSASGGHAAHPAEVVASCQTLLKHLNDAQTDSKRALDDWHAEIEQRDLAEKRRVAPGWLDRDEKILRPERQVADLMDDEWDKGAEKELKEAKSEASGATNEPNASGSEGEELDRMFGGMQMGK